MGGAHYGMGNTTYSSEFNVHCDPEAAHICFDRLPLINLISYELTCDTWLGWEFYDTILVPCTNVYTTFLHAIVQHYVKLYRAKETEKLVVCDMCAMGAVLAPYLIKKSKLMHGHVELAGTHTRGATIFDWRGRTQTANVNVILEMDRTGYHKLAEDLLLLKYKGPNPE